MFYRRRERRPPDRLAVARATVTGSEMAEPTSIAECDRQIAEYQRALKQVSPKGRVAVWEQIDKLLELRLDMTLKAALKSSAHPL